MPGPMIVLRPEIPYRSGFVPDVLATYVPVLKKWFGVRLPSPRSGFWPNTASALQYPPPFCTVALPLQ